MKTPLALAILALTSMPLRAALVTFESKETPAALLELFSSEGCSSCPPAEAWISSLKTRPDLWTGIIPVVFHVDYWNGLGWTDRFASREYTARQRRYAAAWKTNSVYTPGFVLNGSEWRGWFNREPLPAPSAVKAGKLQVTLTDRINATVTFAPADATIGALRAELALLGSNLESDVKRGENGGRKLRHDFVVLHLATAVLAREGGKYTATIALPEKTSEAPSAVAVWVTSGEAQTPLQATGGWLKSP